MSGPLALPPLPFALVERSHPRARSIRITVANNGTVTLTRPPRTPKAEAYRFLHSRLAWIQAALARQRAKAALAPALQWQGADQLPWRGNPLPVQHLPSAKARPEVRFSATGISVLAPANTAASALTRALKAAIIREARLELEDQLLREAARLGVRFTQLRIADTRSQWGSCTRAGQISLSWRLMLAPEAVCRYVVIHELCHLRHPDHSPRFWALVSQQMPEYEHLQEWLKLKGAGLHLWLSG